MEPVGIQTHVDQKRNELLRIQPDSDTQLMDGAGLAIEYQPEGFGIAFHLVSHIIIALRPENPGHDMLHVGLAYSVPRLYVDPAHQDCLFPLPDTSDIHFGNSHRPHVQVHGHIAGDG